MEPGIVSTDLKRTGGVAQYGADVKGCDDRHRPVLVLSARRYQKVTPAKLRTWVEDFAGEWASYGVRVNASERISIERYRSNHADPVSHWRRRGVEKSVIAVTLETNNRIDVGFIHACGRVCATMGVDCDRPNPNGL